MSLAELAVIGVVSVAVSAALTALTLFLPRGGRLLGRKPEPRGKLFTDSGRWRVMSEDTDRLTVTQCLDGVWWYQAPVPRRRHRCTAQSRAWLATYTERCACGGVRMAAAPPLGDMPWIDRNSRTAGAAR